MVSSEDSAGMRTRCALLAMLLAAASSGCRPKACREYAADSKPLGYEAVTAAGGSAASWRSGLRAKLEGTLRLSRLQKIDRPPRMNYQISGLLPPDDKLKVVNLQIHSEIDGARIPAFYVLRKELTKSDPVGLIVLLHGHKSGGKSHLSLRPALNDTIYKLAHAGFVVLVPRIRSLGGFSVDERSHRAYYRSKADGEFLGEVIGDTMSSIRFLRREFPKHTSLGLVGHSFGGVAALHLAALEQGISRVMLSGLFVPYSCLNSGAHDACQRLDELARHAGAHDVAGLIAPRRLLIQFGALDKNYTPAVDGLVAETRKVFAGLGAPDSVEFALTPGIGHELDDDLAVEFFSRKPAS